MKISSWSGNDLTGDWLFTSKIDGIRMTRNAAGDPVTRGGKLIKGLPRAAASLADAELYCGDWGQTMSRFQTGQLFAATEVYGLVPPDERLEIGTIYNPNTSLIKKVAGLSVERGAEGLVLHQGNRWLKVKPRQTYDVPVLDLDIKAGRLVAFITARGRVGVMPEHDRHRYADPRHIGLIIEVASQGLQPSGKFRNASFVRPRFDKMGTAASQPAG